MFLDYCWDCNIKLEKMCQVNLKSHQLNNNSYKMHNCMRERVRFSIRVSDQVWNDSFRVPDIQTNQVFKYFQFGFRSVLFRFESIHINNLNNYNFWVYDESGYFGYLGYKNTINIRNTQKYLKHNFFENSNKYPKIVKYLKRPNFSTQNIN